MALRPALFLDKDGTLLQDIPYNTDPARMNFTPGAHQALARMAALNLPLIVISNQPGIALGKFGFDELARMQGHLYRMCEEAGAKLTDIYCCPHHPDGLIAAYATSCHCRKPEPGLLQVAAQRHSIDLTRSWLVGDILNDVEAGRRVGCRTILINNGNETEWRSGPLRTPDHMVVGLMEAAELLARQLDWHAEVNA